MTRKIIYIAGCGRSGTTITGFVFGNVARAIDLGVVLDFVKFKGRPNGFGPETPNYQFWDGVLRDVEARLGGLDFARLATLQARLDTHRGMLTNLLGLRPSAADLAEYRRFLRALYDRLQEDDRFDVLVDSSKYPSRLEHLLHIYPDDRVCVLHVIRDPIELARAFRKDEQSRPKSFAESMLYSLAINTFVQRVMRPFGPGRSVRVYYEDFVTAPEEQVRHVAQAFDLDASDVIARIAAGEPLARGFVFNGNRMRMQATVRLQKKQPAAAQRRTIFERGFAWLFARAFGQPAADA